MPTANSTRPSPGAAHRRRDADDRAAASRPQSGRTLPLAAPLRLRGRGIAYNPPNRFETVHLEPEPAEAAAAAAPKTEFLADRTRTALARNDSPDVAFNLSVNPYRGCEHGCVYCYARPTHEYLGFSSGLDFERRILVKERAPELLRAALAKPSWRPQVVGMSGVTDPYQPVERRLRITRGCIAALRDFRNPVAIITKNHLVTRDIDLLADLAKVRAAHVSVSVTTLRNDLQRVMEPRTSVPARRLAAIRALAGAGVPVGVFVAPVIPGLTDEEIPAIIAAAADAGARYACFLLLRLPEGVAEHFVQWLDLALPERKDRILARIRDVRGGKLNQGGFHRRFRGQGVYAEHIRVLFRTSVRRAGLDLAPPPLSTAAFRPGGGVQRTLELDP